MNAEIDHKIIYIMTYDGASQYRLRPMKEVPNPEDAGDTCIWKVCTRSEAEFCYVDAQVEGEWELQGRFLNETRAFQGIVGWHGVHNVLVCMVSEEASDLQEGLSGFSSSALRLIQQHVMRAKEKYPPDFVESLCSLPIKDNNRAVSPQARQLRLF